MSANNLENYSFLDVEFKFFYYFNIAIAALCFAFLCFSLLPILDNNVWRHDALININTYVEKFLEEGRWINYLLFDVLRDWVNPKVGALVQIAAIFWFSFQVASPLLRDRFLCVSFACLIATVPTNANMLFWPLTAVPALLFLALTPHLKSLPLWLFFPVCGVVFFGTISNYYFLLPLLFLNESRLESSKKYFVVIFCFWLLGYIFGYLAANLRVFTYFGSFIEIAGWRNPQPVEDIGTLISNIKLSLTTLSQHVWMVFTSLGPLFFVTLISFLFFTFRKLNIFATVLCVFVILSIYASVIPLGLVVAERTTITLWLGLFSLLLLRNELSLRQSALFSLVVFFGVVGLGQKFTDKIEFVKEPLEFHRLKLIELVDFGNRTFEGIMLQASLNSVKSINSEFRYNNGFDNDVAYIEDVDSPHRISGVFKSLGFANVKYCFTPPYEPLLCEPNYSSNLEAPLYEVVGIEGGWLVIRLNHSIMLID